MFYSHQLLARKAPLGQIWMAATMHAKINRRTLDKLDIIKICEQILNPSVPMALRLSGILMGGVVIVYERKVKLLYNDVTHLLVEINEAWKVKSTPADPTRLPKGKTQAKRAAVTLPDNYEESLREIEHSLPYSNATTVGGFQQSYFEMRLDNVDDHDFNLNIEENLNQDYHQADAANITLFDNYDPHMSDADAFGRYERFDIEGDTETQVNFSPPEHTDFPSSIIPSPPRQDDPHTRKGQTDVSERANQNADGSKEAVKEKLRKRVNNRRQKRPLSTVMDDELTIIPGPVYQSWLQNTSDIVSRERKKPKALNTLATKTTTLMDLPSIVLMELLSQRGNREVHYPAPLMEMWMKITQPPHDSPSIGASHQQPPEPSSSSPPERGCMEPMGDSFEVLQDEVDNRLKRVSTEKQRENGYNGDVLPDAIVEALKNSRLGLTDGIGGGSMTTPRNSAGEMGSIPSSGSGNDLSSDNSGRGNGLESVAEELPWVHSDNFDLALLPEHVSTPELLVETGVTQTQKDPMNNQPLEPVTDCIRKHFKTHFDTPGCAKTESINHLTQGMNRKSAACLFYQTCVLATRDCIRLEQKEAYGDIFISRGTKM